MYKIIQTPDGFMVQDKYTGDYISDEHGDNLFGAEHEAQKLLLITRMRDAINNLFDAVVEGDAESIVHLAQQYNNLFGGTRHDTV